MVRSRFPFTHFINWRTVVLAATLIGLAAFFARNHEIPPAYAATFTVTTNDDVNDGTCDASHCSLREAIAAANAAVGKDLISFAIGSGAASIAVGAPLPEITGSVTLDATTQPGYAGTPIVVAEPRGVHADAFREIARRVWGGVAEERAGGGRPPPNIVIE